MPFVPREDENRCSGHDVPKSQALILARSDEQPLVDRVKLAVVNVVAVAAERQDESRLRKKRIVRVSIVREVHGLVWFGFNWF